MSIPDEKVERMYGGRVASQIKRMSDDEYPVIIVSHGKVRIFDSFFCLNYFWRFLMF